jgi:BirA family biotin operon repressor/biotin-[acetyl-CoA-carboxylase] ligase
MKFVHQHLEEVHSTNEILWELSEKVQLSDFHTISADFQTQGKGQDQNSWESEAGMNLIVSFVVFPDFLAASSAFQISRWVSLSILNYLSSKGLKNTSIKWPNDIYVDDEKIAGILIQNGIQGQYLSKSMIGIGLNLNQEIFTSDAPNPISLKNILKNDFDVLEELSNLIEKLYQCYHLLYKNPQKLVRNYHSNMYQLNSWENYQTNRGVEKGKIVGVDEFGRLSVEFENNQISSFDLKEIRFLQKQQA